MSTIAPDLDDVELELEDLNRVLAAAAARVIDALAVVRSIRAGGQHAEAPAPPPSPPRPGSAAGEPPASAAEPTAAAAPAPDSSPPAPRAPADRRGDARRARARLERDATLERVREAFARLGHGWLGSGTVGGEAGLSYRPTARAIAELVAAGELEHNGKGGPHCRYRLGGEHPPPADTPLRPTDPPAPEREPDADPPARDPDPAPRPRPAGPAQAAERRAQREGELGKPTGATTISTRVRRELDREARIKATAFADRDDGVGTFEGRILEALAIQPAGIRTLARRLELDAPNEELVTSLHRMLATGDLHRFTNPDRTTGAETHLYEPRR